MKIDLEINNDLIIWAINRSGYELGEFFDEFPKVKDWLDKTKKPTLKQLEKFARKVHVPFGYLFLDSPPVEKLPIPFFRTVSTQSNQVSLNVYDTILFLQKRQEWLTDYLSEAENTTLAYVGRFNQRNNIKDIVADIKRTLNLDDEWASEFSNWEKAKEYLTQKIEDIGIIVVSSGVVENNNYRKIKVEDCRGFVLVNEVAPFMFINAADSKAAQMFTLAHELAHIWIGESAGFDFRNLQPANNPIEIFCDQISAEFLVPEESLRTAYQHNRNFESLARTFKVSQIVIARRLLDLGFIARPEFFEFYEEYTNQDFRKRESREGGGDFYLTQRKRLSVQFLTYVNNAVRENKLLIRDAYNLTGLKGNTYHNFMREYLY